MQNPRNKNILEQIKGKETSLCLILIGVTDHRADLGSVKLPSLADSSVIFDEEVMLFGIYVTVKVCFIIREAQQG